MNTILKRGLRLGALLVAGMLLFTGGRASAVSGIPVSSCQTLSAFTTYFLSQNINAAGTCFIVGEGTALDLNKHTIKGNGTGDGITDDGSSAPNVVIANGTITRFNNGINMSECCGDSFNLTVNNVTVSLNANDGIFSGSCCNTITNVTAQQNVDDGIDFDDDACCNTFANVNTSNNGEEGLADFEGANLLSGVTSNSNKDGDGIELEGSENKIIASTANGNAGAGIDAGAEDNSIESSTFNNNGHDGVFAGFEGFELVDHVTANGNGHSGIKAAGGQNLVSNSVANLNKDDGIHLNDDDENILLGDTTNTNGFFGAFIECNSNVVRLVAHSNAFSDLCEFDGNCTNVNNFTDHFGCP